MRLSLKRAAEQACCLGPELVATVGRIPLATEPVWDCVVFELRPGRSDVMASFCAPRPALAEDNHPLSPRMKRSWSAPLDEFPLVWFEWDCPDAVPQVPLESICVTDSIVGGSGPREGRCGRALELLCGPAQAAIWNDAVNRLLTALAWRGELLHVAPLRPRGLEHLRLTFFVDAEAIVGWLLAVGWPLPAKPLARTLFRVAMAGQRLGVQLELCADGTLGPYLGIETREFRNSRGARTWMSPLLAEIAAFAPLSPELVTQAPKWPGWNDGLLRHAYTKLVLHEGEWSAKVYIGMSTPALAQKLLSVERLNAQEGAETFVPNVPAR